MSALRLAMIPLGGLFVGVAAALLVLAWRGAASDTVLGQPKVERAAQRSLPRSGDPAWAVLRTTGIHQDLGKGVFRASYPAAVRAMAGHGLSITGYMLPLEAGQATHHFLLSKYTPVCPFCPPGEPNEVIEVRSESAIVPDTGLVMVTGRFSLQHDESAGLFFRLDGAEVSD
ncbi:MAG: DUF3299 domain-containing protein [Caulobacteraceae bacterium]